MIANPESECHRPGMPSGASRSTVRAVAIVMWVMLPWLVMGGVGCSAPASVASGPGGPVGSGADSSGKQASRQGAGRDGAASAHGQAHDRAGDGQGALDARGPMLPLEGVPCAAQTCAYHAGSDGYFLCLNGAAGRCFHYGRSCAPADACMFDARSGSYRLCEQAVEGQCVRGGAACDPPERCMFDRASGLYRTCIQGEPGQCHEFGDVCGPS